MTRVAYEALLASALIVGAHSSTDVRLVDAAGVLSNVGLLQIKIGAGFGTVCGASAATADATKPDTCECSMSSCSQHCWRIQIVFMPRRIDAGQGDLQVDWIHARLREQLPLWFLWRSGLVWGSWFSSGVCACTTFSMTALNNLLVFARPWRICNALVQNGALRTMAGISVWGAEQTQLI